MVAQVSDATTLVVDFIVGKNDLTKELQQAIQLSEQMGKVGAQTGSKVAVNLKDINGHLLTGTSEAKLFTNTIDDGLKRGARSANVFDARMLSLLFGGMALSRAFGGIFRAITNTFTKAEDETSGLGQATERLSGAWEFLKFSIFDALNTDFFINFIDGIVGVLNWFSQLPEGVRAAVLIISGALALLGTGIMIIGQTKLAWGAILGQGGVLTSSAKISGAAGLGGVVVVLGLILVTIGLVALAFKEFPDEAKTISNSLKDNLGGAVERLSESFFKLTDRLDLGSTAFQVLGKAGLGVMMILGNAALLVSGGLGILFDSLNLLSTAVSFITNRFLNLYQLSKAFFDLIKSGGKDTSGFSKVVRGLKDDTGELATSFTDIFKNAAAAGTDIQVFTNTSLAALKDIGKEADNTQQSLVFTGDSPFLKQSIATPSVSANVDLYNDDLTNTSDLITQLTSSKTQLTNVLTSETDLTNQNTIATRENNDEKERGLNLVKEYTELGIKYEAGEDINLRDLLTLQDSSSVSTR